MAKQPKKPKKLHGNQAKVSPDSQITSLYESNTVTLREKTEHETPLVSDDNVEYARRFVEENKK